MSVNPKDIRKRPLRCRLGFHDLFGDSIGQNVGTKEFPMFIINTYKTCNHCGWTTKPQKDVV